MPTSVSQIIEQAVKLTVGLWLARILVRGGAVPGAAGALIGVSVSEIGRFGRGSGVSDDKNAGIHEKRN